jgi:hypothetical protein
VTTDIAVAPGAAAGVLPDTSESNCPVKTPIGAQLTRDLVDDVAKVLETRGFPPLNAQDHGRLHLVLYDFLYEGHGESKEPGSEGPLATAARISRRQRT